MPHKHPSAAFTTRSGRSLDARPPERPRCKDRLGPLCPGFIFLTARSCQSEFGCVADEKLFTVAAAFNRPRDPCDPFLLCASNPLGGCALWVAQSVASPSKMHEWVERSEKRARLAARPPRQSDFRGRPQ